jgi:TetR/AcrR family transcriptional regulator
VEECVANPSPPSPSKGIAFKLWSAARTEFSMRGYHGARVQGIARRAGCNVALLYRHWSSKKSLYLELLQSVWVSKSESIVRLLEQGSGAPVVVEAYLESLLADPEGSQILVREYLDGGPFLSQLVASDPELIGPVRRAVETLRSGNGTALRAGLDPPLVALTIGGLAALVSSAQGAARPFLEREVGLEEWRHHLTDLLLHGLLYPPEDVGRPI